MFFEVLSQGHVLRWGISGIVVRKAKKCWAAMIGSERGPQTGVGVGGLYLNLLRGDISEVGMTLSMVSKIKPGIEPKLKSTLPCGATLLQRLCNDKSGVRNICLAQLVNQPAVCCFHGLGRLGAGLISRRTIGADKIVDCDGD